MKILKYKKGKRNEYQIITDKGEYVLFDDMIIKYELLLKKELKEQEWNKILKENQLLKAYYESLKAINKKLRTKKELKNIFVNFIFYVIFFIVLKKLFCYNRRVP